MQLTAKTWETYIRRLARVNEVAGQKMADYIAKRGTADTDALIAYAYALVTKYGEGSAELACRMYEAIAELQGAAVPPAEPAQPAGYGEVARMVRATQASPPQLRQGVSRLVKRAGADTTLKNALRDGAEFAWVPHGDSCPFCITLASRGWQKASQAAIKGGHAEHIHANCDCEYAIRFDGRTGVAGYDPEKYLAQYRAAGGDINKMRRVNYAANKERINAQKRAAYAAQAYRKDRGAAFTIPMYRRGQQLSIRVQQVESYKTPVFVSIDAEIKPRALHNINQRTESALKQWGVSLDRKPKIVILSDKELDGAVGIYDPCENTVYYAESLGNDAVQESAGGKGAVEAHEMWHMKQAEEFRREGWEITHENRGEYLTQLCEKCKKNLDSLGITRDNVKEISDYAENMYLRKRYDETEAEYKTKMRGGVK